MTKQINGCQDRVRREHNELRIKFNRLDVFIRTAVFNSLPDEERARLRGQRFHMGEYLSILEDRIEWFDTESILEDRIEWIDIDD